MPISLTDLLAQRLYNASKDGSCIEPPDASLFDLAGGYAAQAELLRLRVAAGERLVGVKVAFTNPKMMQRLGVSAPALGHLTDAMQVTSGGTAVIDCVRPRAEAEVAFQLGRDIDLSRLQAVGDDHDQLTHDVAALAPAIELVGSRYPESDFALGRAVADNASAHAFVVGPWSAVPEGLEWAALELELARDGEIVARGQGASILGHPLRSLLAAARIAAEQGRPLRKGHVVLAGAAADPLPVKPGDAISVTMIGFGSASVQLKGRAA